MTASTVKSEPLLVEEWPTLVPLDTPDLLRIDPTHVPAWAGNYSRALSAATETPHELATGLVLITCATAAARRLRVIVRPDYFEPLNLWVLVALQSGNRKSAVQSAATAPLVSWEREQCDLIAPEIQAAESEIKTTQARVKEIRNKAAKARDPSTARDFASEAAELEANMPVLPIPPQLWTSDATPERLGSLLGEHDECMAWLSSEGGVFDLLQGRYSNGIPNLDLVLKAHSGDAERVDRGSRSPVYLRSPRLSIGLSPQPDVLRGLASKQGFRGRGLLGRFLYLLPQSPLGSRTLQTVPIPGHVRRAYDEGIHAMLDWAKPTNENDNESCHILRLSDEALAEQHVFAKAIEANMRPGGDMEHFTDWAGKAPGAAVRLAGVLHGIEHAHGRPWEHAISVGTMNDALEIMAVFLRHSLAALDMMGADPAIAAARRVWDWIKRNRMVCFTEREAFSALRSFSSMKHLREALEPLVERGYILIAKPPQGGRGRPRSPTITVRPEFQEKWR